MVCDVLIINEEVEHIQKTYSHQEEMFLNISEKKWEPKKNLENLIYILNAIHNL